MVCDTILDTQHCYDLVQAPGRLWKLHRKKVPPDARSYFAELLLCLRLHLLPDRRLAVSVVGRSSRYDVRGIAELMATVASRSQQRAAPTKVQEQEQHTHFRHDELDGFTGHCPPSPPPPPLLQGAIWSTAEDFRAAPWQPLGHHAVHTEMAAASVKQGARCVDVDFDSLCFRLSEEDLLAGGPPRRQSGALSVWGTLHAEVPSRLPAVTRQ